ncbi:ankyrin repeat domain-containing protein 54-like [Mytilus californianus]|uniref:ankyrin repeat domain-containing protein 54-like n=1 Tax=Mytilus californianus TaxID=6549 RepID=UPI00224869D2|nr:ankyrin repeat domain-containing protein 54-like [Mytilus californianus]
MQDDEAEGSDSDCLKEDTSSSEGEYPVYDKIRPSSSLATVLPEVDVSKWSPKGPACLQYLCLVPFVSIYNPEYQQSSSARKVKISVVHRKRRMKEITGRTNCRNILDERRLRNAANENDFETVVELLEGGVDVCNADEKKRTALHFSSSQGNDKIVKALLDKGANPNLKDLLGNTPLHLAACTGKVPTVTLLLKAGTDIKSVDNFGRTPITLAKSRLKFLVEDKTYSSQRVKDEALEVTDMMKTFLNISGQTENAGQLEELCDRLKQVSTREDVDHVNQLLSNFASLAIEKNGSVT